MHTYGEIAATLSLWLLTAAGTYFSVRAAMHRRECRCTVRKRSDGNQTAFERHHEEER